MSKSGRIMFPGESFMSDLVGWLATAIFSSSYFVKNPIALRLVQASSSLCWMIHGIQVHSRPLMIANIIAITLALGSAWQMAAKPGA
jgi:hypothetical protein